MRHYAPGSVIHKYKGRTIKNRKGEVVTKATFGYEEGQIKVTALGRTKDRIRLTDVSSGEEHEISRYQYERLKEELYAGYFKNKDIFFRATYWQTQEGMNARDELATKNFGTMLDERYGEYPDFHTKKPYLEELFRGLSHSDKQDFFEKEDKLIRDLWTYGTPLPTEDYPELANSNELDFLINKLEEEYYHKDSNALKMAYIRSITSQTDNDITRMLRNV